DAGRNRAAAGARRQRRLDQRARRGRAGQQAAAQDRERPGQSADHPDGARHRLPAGGLAMIRAVKQAVANFDPGFTRLRAVADNVSDHWARFNVWFRGMMPKGLYPRALLIIIAPMVILQSVIAFVFME